MPSNMSLIVPGYIVSVASNDPWPDIYTSCFEIRIFLFLTLLPFNSWIAQNVLLLSHSRWWGEKRFLSFPSTLARSKTQLGFELDSWSPFCTMITTSGIHIYLVRFASNKLPISFWSIYCCSHLLLSQSVIYISISVSWFLYQFIYQSLSYVMDEKYVRSLRADLNIIWYRMKGNVTVTVTDTFKMRMVRLNYWLIDGF